MSAVVNFEPVDEYVLTEADDALAQQMSDTRNSTPRKSTSTSILTDNPKDFNKLGAYGEIAVAHRYGLEVDTALRKGGDGGVDFSFFIKGMLRTMDVKTASKDYPLLVKEHNINRCADYIVLCDYHKETHSITFAGWDIPANIAASTPKSFTKKADHKNYFRERKNLRPMKTLDERMKQRTYE